MMRKFATAFLFIASTALIAEAQTRAAHTPPEVTEATFARTTLKVNNTKFSQYRFVLVWKDAAPPAEGFFYRNGKDWKETTIARPERRQFGGGPNDYMMVENTIEAKDVRKGDRIVLTTHRHDHNEEEIPAAVKKMAGKGLFYAVGSGTSVTWKVVQIAVKTLPDRVQ